MALLAVALLATACGTTGDDGDASVEEPAGAEATDSYADRFEAAATAVAIALDDLSAANSAAAAGDSAALREVSGSVARFAGVVGEQAALLNQLDPPDALRGNHRFLVEWMADLQGQADRQAAAAEEGDVEGYLDQGLGMGADQDELRRELPPELLTRLILADARLDAFDDLTGADRRYLSDVAGANTEFAVRNQQFGQAFSRAYADSAALLDALLEAGAGTAFAAVRTAFERTEPTPRFEQDAEIFGEMLDRKVEIDEAIAAAAERGDIVEFLTRNAELGRVDAEGLRRLSGPFRAVASVGSPVARLEIDPPGDPYGRSLAEALAALALAAGLPTPYGFLDAFVPLTEEEKAAVMAAIAPDLEEVVRATRREIAALAPPEPAAADHARILTHLDEVAASAAEVGALAGTGDLDGAVASDQAITGSWCRSAAALSADALAQTIVYFDPFGARLLCAGS